MIPRGKPFPNPRGQPVPLCCPWCLIVDVRFETLVPGQVVSSGPSTGPEHMDPPYCRYACEVCRYAEIHTHLMRWGVPPC